MRKCERERGREGRGRERERDYPLVPIISVKFVGYRSVLSVCIK